MKMTTIFLAAALLFAGLSCNDGKKDENITVTTTEEVKRTDTVSGHLRTTTAVTRTVETDSTETEITTGNVKVEPVE
jgi:hypothetical protein